MKRAAFHHTKRTAWHDFRDQVWVKGKTKRRLTKETANTGVPFNLLGRCGVIMANFNQLRSIIHGQGHSELISKMPLLPFSLSSSDSPVWIIQAAFTKRTPSLIPDQSVRNIMQQGLSIKKLAQSISLFVNNKTENEASIKKSDRKTTKMCFKKEKIFSRPGLVRIIIGVCQHVISSSIEPNLWCAGSEQDFKHDPLQFFLVFRSFLAKTKNYSEYVWVSFLCCLFTLTAPSQGAAKHLLNLQSTIKGPQIHDWREIHVYKYST